MLRQLTPDEIKILAENIFSPDQVKVMYRGNFTFKQAALYMGRGVDWIQMKVDAGELGIIPEKDEDGNIKEMIPRRECDRWLFENVKYRKGKKP